MAPDEASTGLEAPVMALKALTAPLRASQNALDVMVEAVIAFTSPPSFVTESFFTAGSKSLNWSRNAGSVHLAPRPGVSAWERVTECRFCTFGSETRSLRLGKYGGIVDPAVRIESYHDLHRSAEA